MSTMQLGMVEKIFADIIWENEPIPSGELVKICNERLKWKKSTTYTVLKKLSERGLFENKNSMVSAIISKEDYYRETSKEFVQNTFNGSLPAFIAAFTSGENLSEGDVRDILKILGGL